MPDWVTQRVLEERLGQETMTLLAEHIKELITEMAELKHERNWECSCGLLDYNKIHCSEHH